MNFYEVSWAVRHEPDGSYVVEHEDDRPKVTHGPMPAHLVAAFLRERQAIWRWTFDRAIERLNRETKPNG